MVVVMAPGADESQIEEIASRLRLMGLSVHRSDGRGRVVLGAIGDLGALDVEDIRHLPGVQDVVRISVPYKLVSRAFRADSTIIRVRDAEIGGETVTIMAGPCAVESEDQVEEVAASVARTGAKILRGGAYKPRTSPYTFQGLGEEGLRILRRCADRHGLAVVSEVLDTQHVPIVERHVDILQVGARNMQNFALLREVGRAKKPVLLKRGLSATIEEWLMAAEYVLAGGNHDVMLCERGIRTFETLTRNTLDLSCVPMVHQLSHLPVIVDPSHATGIRDKVPPMSLAAVAAGADGVMVEVHPHPEMALSDGAQSLDVAMFEDLVGRMRAVAAAVGRKL
ncbi:MAG: 3-deoxy-7-phosphoheptulonate synthase [Candidatus Eiseniibacteriota bacterium]